MASRSYRNVRTQLTDDDKRSLLAIQSVFRTRVDNYRYLEIGSYLGGSLQPYLVDPRCTKVYSIDRRVLWAPDERGTDSQYPGNSTWLMLDTLSRFYDADLSKLACLEGDVRTIDPAKIDRPVSICFIDGEHTDAACFDDFTFCLSVVEVPAIVVLHDVDIIFRGLQRCLKLLDERRLQYHAYCLPTHIGVIELGRLELFKDQKILGLVSQGMSTMLDALQSLSEYRDRYARINQNRVFRFMRTVYRLGRRVRRSLRRNYW